MVVHEADLQATLQQYFGFTQFRGKQEAVVRHLLAGQDTFVIMPTGAGKSLCYQLPAVVSEGMALVISPLIALMKNQVDQLQQWGIAAGFMNSSQNRAQYEEIRFQAMAGNLKLLYVAPESLVREEFQLFLQRVNISFVAIDEAHCISEWGHDFRPEYRRIRPMLNQIPRVPVIALTATATPKVQQDIQENLQIDDAGVFKTSFNRINLFYEVQPKTRPTEQLVKFVKAREGQSGIVYCLSRKKVEELTETLRVNGVSAVPYHAGLDAETRGRHQDAFLQAEVDIVVATIAFGMGIDKPDVRFVVHYDAPKSIESYYQETGRAGRDGQHGHCLLLYDFADIVKLEKFMKDKPVSERDASKHLLQEMAAYAEGALCRRHVILHYFGEEYEQRQCPKLCDNCQSPVATYDATELVGHTLYAVSKSNGHYPAGHYVNLLRGHATEAIKHAGHEALEAFGKAKQHTEPALRDVIHQMVVRQFLERDIQEYGLLRVGPVGAEFLTNPYPVQLRAFKDVTKGKREAAPEEPKPAAENDDLFLQLERLRQEVAQKNRKQPWHIFFDGSLREMAIKYPITTEELQQIAGVNANKAKRYGQPFLELIADFVAAYDIDRDADIVVKSTPPLNSLKPFIIQQVDRKTPLEEIAERKSLSVPDILDRMEQIVYAGSRLNVDYILNELDPDACEEIFAYFKTAQTDELKAARQELGPDYDAEEIRLVRLQFLSKEVN